MTNVNNTLTLAKTEIQIVGVTWSLAGNCILLVCNGHTAASLRPFAESIAHFLTKQIQQIKTISKDKPWPQVVIDRVDMGILQWDETPSPHSMEHIIDTLHANNPCFANIKLKELPRWICGHKTIIAKKHYSSLVITLNTETSQRELLNHKFIFSWGHPRCIKEYLNMKLTQCLKCWNLMHNTSACTHNINADIVEKPTMNANTPDSTAKKLRPNACTTNA
jgi:hypothetical protein